METGRILAERYELVRPLAEGAMSTVWVARDREENADVAIKAISLDAAGWRAEVRDRFMKEARLLALGKHDHLVGVRDVGETDDGYLYLVLDLLEGETLAERIGRDPPLGWKEAASLSLAVGRGVAALHRAGIVHRDLKPANIILHRTEAGEVPKIIDLGISKVRAAAADPELCATLTATGQVLGTPQYMSYEQALGEPDVDARSDVWALGVILYEMLARRRPFEAPNANAVLAAIRRKEAPPLTEVAHGVPTPIVEIVERCLRTNRDERFSDASELCAALEAAIEAANAAPTPPPVSKPKPSPLPPKPTPKSPAPSASASPRSDPKPVIVPANAPEGRRTRALVGVMLVVAVVSGTVVMLVSPRNPPERGAAVPSAKPASTPTSTTLVDKPVSAASAPASPASATAGEVAQPATKATVAPQTSVSGPPLDHVPVPAKSGKAPITKVNEAGF